MVRVVAGVLATIILLSVAGCGGVKEAGVPPSQELVPEGANLIAQLHVAKVVDDEDVPELYAAIPKDDEDAPATFQGLLDLILENTGIDLRGFSRAILFGDTGREDFFALIAEGTFDQQALLRGRGIEKAAAGHFSTTDYRGHELHTFVAEGESPGPSDSDVVAVVFLDKDTLALGLAEAVQEVVDVKVGDRKAMTGPVMDRYNALGDPWFKIALEVPTEGLEDIPEMPAEIPFDLSFIADVRVVGASLDKTGEELQVRLALDFSAEESATRTRDAIGGTLTLLRSFLPDERTRELLGGILVTSRGATLTISFEASATEIRALMENPPDLDTGGIFQ